MENDLKFSGVSPVVINYTGSSDDIYSPIRGSSCDITIVSDKILDDIYTARKNDISVKVQKTSGEVVYDYRYSTGQYYWSKKPIFKIYVWEDDEMTECWVDRIRRKFTDVDGDLMILADYSGPSIGFKTNVWLRARRTNVQATDKGYVFDVDNKWNMNTDDMYFYVGETSYRVRSTVESDPTFWIDKWTGSAWSEIGMYSTYYENGDWDGPCSYDSVNVIHYSTGDTELVNEYGCFTFVENSNDAGWRYTGGMYKLNGSDFVLYGEWAKKSRIYTSNSVEVIDVIGNVNFGQGKYLYQMNPETHTITELVSIPAGSEATRMVNDSDNNLFAWELNGYMRWLKNDVWIPFSVKDSTFVSDTFILRWQVDDVFVGTGAFNVDNVEQIYEERIWWDTKPSLWVESQTVYSTKTLWQGYKVPNTYTQSVSLNLDQITMTAIDPVGMLKYVKVKNIIEKNRVMTYGEMIGAALAAVKLYSRSLSVERSVSYGTEKLLDLKCHSSNFWNEIDDDSTAYDMIAELLRPFCLTLVFGNSGFQIYNVNKTGGVWVFDIYNIRDDGTLVYSGNSAESTVVYDGDSWQSNNVQEASIEIGSTYDRFDVVASTMIPDYLQMVFDVVDYNQKNRYNFFDLNVQRNKTNGYLHNGELVTEDRWYYIWNGVYVDELYRLKSVNNYNNGYLNCNKAYEYLTGESGHPTDYGSVLNFYGGAVNPSGIGKEQETDKSVNVKKRITAYAPDNGTPLEFLENSDLGWSLNTHYDPNTGESDPVLTKTNSSSEKFGASKQMGSSDRIVYHQESDMLFMGTGQYEIGLNLNQSYSRTGVDEQIDVLDSSNCTNKMFYLNNMDEQGKWTPHMQTCDVKYFPTYWNAKEVTVDTSYFNRYTNGRANNRPTPVWDKRRVDIYVESGDSVWQFNGKAWVQDTAPKAANAFYLVKLMTGQKLYHTSYKYDIIETYDHIESQETDHVSRDAVTGRYSLTNEPHIHYIDEYGGYTKNNVIGSYKKEYPVYYTEANEWYDSISEVGEGVIRLKLPNLDVTNIKVNVDVYNSTILGMTGSSTTNTMKHEYVLFDITGRGQYYDDYQGQYVTITLAAGNTQNYGQLDGANSHINFMPQNTTYVKAEHLDLNISLDVPQSNLGQVFNESDIRYSMDSNNDLVEEYNLPSFLVNTYNSLVYSSFSYIISGNDIADPDEFIINNIPGRPEYYVLQAYKNWLGVIRKTYKKTLVLNDRNSKFNNIRGFIKSPEIGDNKLMVISDSIDLKTNRHTVSAIECHNLDVVDVELTDTTEIPRRARYDRFNLPTAVKK